MTPIDRFYFSNQLKNSHPRIVLTLSLAMLVMSCGGGGASTTTAPQAQSPVPTTPTEPTLVVQTSAPMSSTTAGLDNIGCDGVAGDSDAAFSDISFSAGLCYQTNQTPEDSLPSRVAGGIAVSDFNNDQRWDVYVTQGRNTAGKLFQQNAEQAFLDVTASLGIVQKNTDHSALFYDINRDGLQDLISVQEAPTFLQIFANQGDAGFQDITSETGINLTKHAYTVAAGDPDLDGDLDLFFAHWQPWVDQSRWEYLWENQGVSQFKDISDMVEVGRFSGSDNAENPQLNKEYSFTPIFADINDDRYPDLLIASDWNTTQALINNGGTELMDSGQFVFSDRAGMGAAVADYDNDGDLDWFVSAIGDTREEFLTIGLYNGNRLYQNDGAGNFTNVTDFAGVRQAYWGWGSCFADFNNDGHLDLFIVNGFDGMVEEDSVNKSFENFNTDRAVLYINNQDGRFTERSAELGVNHTAMGRGLACFDYDKDGDQDMLIANSGESPTLLRNNNFGSENNFINVRLKCDSNNPECVGARVLITIGEEQQMRELQKGNNYVSQNPVVAHFGLGNATSIDEVKIIWPGLDAEQNVLQNVDVNQFLTIHQPN